MSETLSETRYKRPRVASAKSEWGDCKDVLRTFGFRESFVYHLWRTNQITSVLIRGTGPKGTGKRLFSYDSIRRLIKEAAAKAEK